MQNFDNWLKNRELLMESSSDSSRYSVEVNYRSKTKEVLDAFAKICLGYVSAAMKNADYHIKQIYDHDPLRVLVSNRNWDDGEWVSIVSWNPHHRCFFISKGFYNKVRKTVSVQSTDKCEGDNAAEIVRKLKNIMHNLKDKPDRHMPKLKKVPLKRGPK